MKGETLFLVTLSFPYTSGGENTFLQHEIVWLKKFFEKVIILPISVEGERQILDNSFVVDLSLAESLNKFLSPGNYKRILNVFKERLLFRELWSKPSLLINPVRFFKLISYIDKVIEVKSFLRLYLPGRINKKDCAVCYTYWFTHFTTASCLLKAEWPNFKVVSRAHGIDLYEWRNNNYIPLRQQTLSLLDRLYLVSESGYNYIKKRHPQMSEKLRISGLGVAESNIIASQSKQGNFSIVSCSTIDKNKRVELIFLGIVETARKHRDIKFIWTHFGDGNMRSEIEKLLSSNEISNLKVELKGHVDPTEIFVFYKNVPVDVFITTSASEGGRPVSIQEAQSCGIPVIGTNTGGIPEIVNSKTGILLSQNPDSVEISNAISWLLKHPADFGKMRNESLMNWNDNFNADKKFSLFARDMSDLLK